MREILNIYVDISIKILGLISSILFITGGLVVLRYCISIDYYPSGIGMTDGLFFISIAIMFFVVYGVFIVLIVSLSCLVYSLLRIPVNFIYKNLNNKDIELVPLSEEYKGINAVGLLSLLFLIISYFINYKLFKGSVIFIGIQSFILLLLFSRKKAKQPIIYESLIKESKKNVKGVVKWALIVLMCILPFAFSNIFLVLCEITINNIGMKIKNVDISLNNKYISLFPHIKENKSKNNFIVKNITVLWKGVGDEIVFKENGTNSRYILLYKDIALKSEISNK